MLCVYSEIVDILSLEGCHLCKAQEALLGFIPSYVAWLEEHWIHFNKSRNVPFFPCFIRFEQEVGVVV